MKGFELFRLCSDERWPEARKYVSSANIMYRHDDHGQTCFLLACIRGAPDDTIKTMLDSGGKELVMMTMTDDGDDTVLHVVCYSGASYNIIKMLIEVGGKDLVMAKNKNGTTALHLLCRFIKEHNDAYDKIKLFLQAGDANLLLSANKDHAGETLLEIATGNGASKKIKELLKVQSTSPIADIMKVDLIELCDDNQYKRASIEELEIRVKP